jgi:hypothetical protein
MAGVEGAHVNVLDRAMDPGQPISSNQAERSSHSASSRSTAVTPHPRPKNDALGGSSNVNQYR